MLWRSIGQGKLPMSHGVHPLDTGCDCGSWVGKEMSCCLSVWHIPSQQATKYKASYTTAYICIHLVSARSSIFVFFFWIFVDVQCNMCELLFTHWTWDYSSPISQSVPVYPAVQVQLYRPMLLLQVAPLWHGLHYGLWDYSSPISQSVPVYPAVQVQLYRPMLLLQVAPWWHGLLVHSSMSKTVNNVLCCKTSYGKNESKDRVVMQCRKHGLLAITCMWHCSSRLILHHKVRVEYLCEQFANITNFLSKNGRWLWKVITEFTVLSSVAQGTGGMADGAFIIVAFAIGSAKHTGRITASSLLWSWTKNKNLVSNQSNYLGTSAWVEYVKGTTRR